MTKRHSHLLPAAVHHVLNATEVNVVSGFGVYIGAMRQSAGIPWDNDHDFFLMPHITYTDVVQMLEQVGFQCDSDNIHVKPIQHNIDVAKSIIKAPLDIPLDDVDTKFKTVDFFNIPRVAVWMRDFSALNMEGITQKDELYKKCQDDYREALNKNSFYVQKVSGYTFTFSNFLAKYYIRDTVYSRNEKALGIVKPSRLSHLVPPRCKPINLFEQKLNGAAVILNLKHVVFDGVFDILHAGHIDFIRRIKMEYGESECLLTVAVISDEWCKKYKGEYPFVDQDNRASAVAALADVDRVIIVDDESFLDDYKHYVTSAEYEGHPEKCKWSAERATKFLPRSSFGSSTDIKASATERNIK